MKGKAPKFEINEVARVMVAGNIVRIHEIFMSEDDIGNLDQAIKYVVVGTDGCVFTSLDERMIMKESCQEYGASIPKAGEVDVSKDIRKEVVPVKATKPAAVTEKPKRRTYKKKSTYKRKASPKKKTPAKTKRTKKPPKGDPFNGIPDF